MPVGSYHDVGTQKGKMSLAGMLKSILPFVVPYKRLVAAALALTFAGSVLAQVNAVVLDKAVDAINALVNAEFFSWRQAAAILFVVSSVLLGKELGAAVVTFFQRYCGEQMRILVRRDLAFRAVGKLLSFRLAYYAASDNETGKVQARIDRGLMSLSRTVSNFFIEILPLFTSAVLALGLMFAANVYVGAVALGIVPVYFYVTYIQAGRMKGGRRRVFKSHQAVSHGLLNLIESITVIKSFNREASEYAKQSGLQQSMSDLQMHVSRQGFLFNGLKSFLEQIGTVLIIILTAYLVLIGYPGMSIGKIMYHVMLFANVSAPIRQLHRIYDDMNDALVYAEEFFSILNADGEVEQKGQYRPDSVRGDFVLKNVSFSYENGTKALTDIDMRIESGKITALVGLSGAGKSTLVNLLDKFYEPEAGAISLDGVDLQEWDTQWLRENVGLVLQKNHIFDGTIAENILYGRPDASFGDVERAAKQAQLYDQIMRMPAGFDTQAQDLSGGQQQRIALARVFLKDPPVLFLDEPTASLDAIAAEQIKSAIDAVKKDRTVVIISHNIGQIIDADILYVLDRGHVVESGTPKEVYLRGGLYKEIFDASARSMNIGKIAGVMESSAD